MENQTAHQLIQDIGKELVSVRSEVKDLDWKIRNLQSKAEELENQLDKVENQLIPPSEYKIVKQLIFGAVGLALVALIGALISQVLK